MMLSVGLVIGLGAVALYLSKRALPRVAKAASKEIHVLETAHLGPRKALHLVKVGGRRLLIASTSDSVTMLAGIPEREEPCLESGPQSRNSALGTPNPDPPMDDAWPDASKREGLPPAEKSRWVPEPNSERR
jgi:flagellar biogenesis protein FliO